MRWNANLDITSVQRRTHPLASLLRSSSLDLLITLLNSRVRFPLPTTRRRRAHAFLLLLRLRRLRSVVELIYFRVVFILRETVRLSECFRSDGETDWTAYFV